MTPEACDTIDQHDIWLVHVELSGLPVYDAKGEESAFWWPYTTGTTGRKSEMGHKRIGAQRWGPGRTT